MHQTVSAVNEKVKVIKTTNAQSDFLKTLACKSIDMEARLRWNNLIFRGFIENYGQDCTQM